MEEDAARVLARDLPWHRLSGGRVLVTGAAGFLGSHLVHTLLALQAAGQTDKPVRVLALVRSLARARARWGALMEHPDLEWMEWDLARIAVPDLRGCTHVLHAASQASPRYYGADPVGTLLPNTVGTAALLQALAASVAPQAFLFISSSEVYGAAEAVAGLPETEPGRVDPASLRACYAESKRLGETLCVAWHHQHGLATRIVRLFHTYGPGLQPEDGRVHADFVYNVLRGEDIVMSSDGSARRCFCYVSDAVAGIFTVLLQGEAATPYNVGHAEAELSVLELAQLLVGLAPQRRLQVERVAAHAGAGYLPSGYARLRPDVSRLAALGWRAEVMPAQGFARMLQACAA